MEATKAANGSCSFAIAAKAAGGPALFEVSLFADMFAAGGAGGLRVDLMEMKVSELREELEARDEAKSGCKPWLRRRLHAAIVRERVAARAAGEGV